MRSSVSPRRTWLFLLAGWVLVVASLYLPGARDLEFVGDGPTIFVLFITFLQALPSRSVRPPLPLMAIAGVAAMAATACFLLGPLLVWLCRRRKYWAWVRWLGFILWGIWLAPLLVLLSMGPSDGFGFGSYTFRYGYYLLAAGFTLVSWAILTCPLGSFVDRRRGFEPLFRVPTDRG